LHESREIGLLPICYVNHGNLHIATPELCPYPLHTTTVQSHHLRRRLRKIRERFLFVIVAAKGRHQIIVNTALACLAFLVLSSPALAAGTLAYEAPSGCPTRPEFAAAVASRGANFDGAETPPTGRTMVVSIRKQGDDFVGTFQVRDDHAATSKREVRGKSCNEVADALAVVTAIELHPTGEARTESDTLPAKENAPPNAPSETRLRGHTQSFPPRSETVQVGAGPLRFDLQRSITAYAGATVGMIPSVVLPRFELSFAGANFVTTPEGTQRLAGPVTRVRLSFLGPASYQSTGTTTDMDGVSFGVGLCQSPLYDTRGLVLLFCTELGGGLMSLRTKGTDGAQIQSKNAGFGTVIIGAEAQYDFTSWFHVGAQLGGGVTYGQLTAERADGSRIFESSAGAVGWTAEALLGAGGHF
jgi:hypothetical protein